MAELILNIPESHARLMIITMGVIALVVCSVVLVLLLCLIPEREGVPKMDNPPAPPAKGLINDPKRIILRNECKALRHYLQQVSTSDLEYLVKVDELRAKEREYCKYFNERAEREFYE